MENHEDWNQKWQDNGPFNLKKLNKYYDQIGVDHFPRNSNVLDLGCGSGEFIQILREKGFTSVTGLEPQIELIKKDKTGCVQQGNCLDPPKVESFYDVVIMLGVLHHLKTREEIRTCHQNVRKMLRPGGAFISLEPRNTYLRWIATRTMFALPMFLLPCSVKLDRILYQQEIIEVSHWLQIEREVRKEALSLGFKLKEYNTNWRYTCQVLERA